MTAALQEPDQEEMSDPEIEECCRQWQAFLDNFEGRVGKELFLTARAMLHPASFGWEEGQLRPIPRLIPIDLYRLLADEEFDEGALTICQLTRADVQRAFAEEEPIRLDEVRDPELRAIVLGPCRSYYIA